MEPTKARPGSLEALGLQRFMDENYYLRGGYVKLVEMFEADASNAEIARAFSPTDRQLHRQSVRPWRAKWKQEKKEIAQ